MPAPAPTYKPCAATDVPDGVRFDIPARHQGQTVEVAYGGFTRYAHNDGAPWKRVIDTSQHPRVPTYYANAANR